jgi:LmbE family N-acetylglucosaminyl deacetylase
MERILVFCAHSDDELVGMGGTILKFAKEKKEIVKVIFSYGEKSHPHLRKEVIIKERVDETKKASKLMGISKTIFFGLEDYNLKNEIKKYNIKNKLKTLIKNYKPKKIFIPSPNDSHKDHRAVHEVVIKSVDEMKYNSDIYTYEVWNIINDELPYIYIDITPYFSKKLKIIKEFESQKHFLYPLLIPIFYRSIKYGRANNCKYAEKFYKVR